MKKLLLAALFALGLAAPALGQTVIVASCPSGTGIGGSAGSTGRPYAIDVNGNVCFIGSAALTGTSANNADAVASVATGLTPVADYMFVYNGTTWDRLRGDTTAGAWTQLKAAIPAGSAIIGKIGIDQTAPGTTNLVAAGQSGTWTVQPGNTANSTAWLMGLNAAPSVANGNGVIIAPSSATSAALTPQTTAAAASNAVLKGSAGNLYDVTVTIGATSGWVMVFDATSLPSNGATGASLKWCYPVLSNGTVGGINKVWHQPISFATGITVGFSSTACNSLTASATAFFYGGIQ